MQVLARNRLPLTAEQQIDNEVFKQAFIPRTLDSVIDYEKDINRANKGDTTDVCVVDTTA